MLYGLPPWSMVVGLGETTGSSVVFVSTLAPAQRPTHALTAEIIFARLGYMQCSEQDCLPRLIADDLVAPPCREDDQGIATLIRMRTLAVQLSSNGSVTSQTLQLEKPLPQSLIFGRLEA